ncbi:MerR family DNA-binding transcriptional regulator [Streptomyces sp. MS1.AVA.3]
MRIGDAAAAAGMTPRALRYYEQQGLVTEAARPEAEAPRPECEAALPGLWHRMRSRVRRPPPGRGAALRA